MTRRVKVLVKAADFEPEYVGALLPYGDGWYTITGFHTDYVSNESMRRVLKVCIDQYGHMEYEMSDVVSVLVLE